ncbi:olfactory receptor 8H2-like [Anoplopoma fimbria]|uniref:olfactory receptor 8H2-like n=1 Tax=Anoplopoma fimbria TaxID=229290 RepID=UPI0023EB7ED2|nr:olfactory receptor 8H2-like [Anoplopoma fimbria]
MDNVSQVSSFFLSSVNVTKNHQVALFSLTLLSYCFVVLVNVALIVTIILDKNMHEPMYILLCTFCMNGLYGTTGFYPKVLWDLLSPVYVISYSGCLVQAFVIASFVCSDLSILAVMAYDRYVAICRPLEYHSIMSKERVLLLVCFSWITPFCMSAINIVLTSRLKLCSQYIARLYCLNWIIVKLACFPAERIANNIFSNITIIIYVFHVFFIIWSYVYVIKTCVNSLENRAKFMQTCVPHLTSLLIFLVTIFFDICNMRFGSNLSPTIQNVLAIELLIIPPIMNPLVYGFKLTKIRNRILGGITCKIKCICPV